MAHTFFVDRTRGLHRIHRATPIAPTIENGTGATAERTEAEPRSASRLRSSRANKSGPGEVVRGGTFGTVTFAQPGKRIATGPDAGVQSTGFRFPHAPSGLRCHRGNLAGRRAGSAEGNARTPMGSRYLDVRQ